MPHTAPNRTVSRRFNRLPRRLPGCLLAHLPRCLLCRLPRYLVGGAVLAVGVWIGPAPAAPAAPVAAPAPVAVPVAQPGLWRFPCADPVEIARPFEAPPHRYAAGHRGIDVAGPACDTILAPAAGVVSFVGTVVDRPVISVQVDESTVYALEPVVSTLAVGDTVTAGAVLGSLAAGGHCHPRCVHFGVRVDHDYVNPLRLLFARPVLLPW